MKLSTLSPPVIPYYAVHPFRNGTLKSQQIPIEKSIKSLREIARGPGWLTPKLVVPTKFGKCCISPFEKLKMGKGQYALTTKDGFEIIV